MEWVETTGRTVEEAKDAALDQLGVDEQDAEFEVLEEPKSGLFGRLRTEARVRARVRPTRPRPKVERRDRRRKSGKASEAKPAADAPAQSTAAPRGRPRREEAAERAPATDEEGTEMDHDVTVEEQGEIVARFLSGLAGAFGYDAEATTTRIDDDTLEVALAGDHLGLLIGPKGQTLQAVHELARTVVLREAPGSHEGRVRVDIGGYRQRRREALERFTHQVAEQVRESGMQKALEPMNPADRKVVHDTVNGIDGVTTVSEGQEPRRRVVILPNSD